MGNNMTKPKLLRLDAFRAEEIYPIENGEFISVYALEAWLEHRLYKEQADPQDVINDLLDLVR